MANFVQLHVSNKKEATVNSGANKNVNSGAPIVTFHASFGNKLCKLALKLYNSA